MGNLSVVGELSPEESMAQMEHSIFSKRTAAGMFLCVCLCLCLCLHACVHVCACVHVSVCVCKYVCLYEMWRHIKTLLIHMTSNMSHVS